MSEANVYVVWNSKTDLVDRVFSTREKAEEWIGSNGDEYYALDYPLDEFREDRTAVVYYADVDLETGEVADPPLHSPRGSETETVSARFRDHACIVTALFNGQKTGRLCARAKSVVSREHAIELAHTERQEWLKTQAQATTNVGAAVDERVSEGETYTGHPGLKGLVRDHPNIRHSSTPLEGETRWGEPLRGDSRETST